MRVDLCRLAAAVAAAGLSALAQGPAAVTINTSQSTPLNPNFSGFNDEVVFPPEFWDYRLNVLAAQLQPGWVRYPSGLFSEAFNWQTGMMVPDWVAQFSASDEYTLLSESIGWVNGKGGGLFVDAANRANFWGAKIVVDVNGFTDTAASAGAMAAFAKANHIEVAAWELCNEPYLFKNFFASGTDYLNKMKPYYDAIKAADPSAIVAVFVNDPGGSSPNNPWDAALANYPDPYWDAITFHYYPAQSSGAFSQWMADENGILATYSSAYVTGYLEKLFPNTTRFLNTEFLPSNDGLGTGSSITDGTLYGAVYGAEYMMRMSTVPAMIHAGPHALTGSRGVYAVNTHYTDTQAAYAAGTTIDTLSLNFGFFETAQQLGVAVLNGALRTATTVESTAVSGGPAVPATGPGTIPALYAQAYASATGTVSVVITNKGATATPVNIVLNGTPVSGTLPLTLISGSDPTVQNTATDQDAVAITTSTATNPVTIPAYSVVRVDLNSPSAITAANSASYSTGTVAPSEIVALFSSAIPATLTANSVTITDSSGRTQPAAQVFSAASGFATVLLPSALATGPASIGLTGNPATAAPVTVASSAPGLFTMNSNGAGVAAADAFLVTPSGTHVNQTVFTCNSSYQQSCLPAPMGVGGAGETLIVVLYGTGIRGAQSVQAYVAGESVPVLYAGEDSLPGLDQVNISIPQTLAGSGDVLVYLVADGVYTNAVTLTIQ